MVSSRPRLASPRPGPRRASKRLNCRLWKCATSCINIIERERLSWSRQEGTSFWVRFLHLKLNDFWSRSGGLPCSRPLLPTRCWFVWRWCVSALEQCSGRRCRGGLKPDLQGGNGFNLLRVHFWVPVQRKCVSKRGQKVGPALKSKVVPPGGSSFGPFLAPSLWQICWCVYFKLKLIWPATAAAGISNWGGPFLRACFFLRFEV